MDMLLTYESDSDDTEVGSGRSVDEKGTVSVSGSHDSMESPPDSFACHVATTGLTVPDEIDYFKLNCSSDEEECCLGHLPENKSKQSREVQNNVDQSIDPSLTFWNDDVKISEVKSVICDSKMKRKAPPDGNLSFPEAHCHTAVVQEGVRTYSSKKQKTLSSQGGLKDMEFKNLENKKAQCLKVHGKIAPLLNRDTPVVTFPKSVSKTFDAHSGAINKIAWCIPQFSHLIASASMDKTVSLWNMYQKDIFSLRSFRNHKKAVTDVAWSATGRNLLTCSYDKIALINDVETGVVVTKCEHLNFVTVGRYHPVNCNYFVTGTQDELYCWDVRETSQPVKRYVYKDKFGLVRDLVFRKDGGQFFTCNDLVTRDSADKNIMAWDFNKHVVISNQIYQERFTCTRLRVHPIKEEFLAQSHGDYIAQFSTQRPYKMNKCKRFESHKVMGYNVGFDISMDGRYILSGSADGKVYIYNYNNAKSIQQINLGERTVCLDVACHPVCNSTVAVSTWNGKIHLLT